MVTYKHFDDEFYETAKNRLEWLSRSTFNEATYFATLRMKKKLEGNYNGRLTLLTC